MTLQQEQQHLLISTHALTWSATATNQILFAPEMHFNSRAHVERDVRDRYKIQLPLYFNSRAHVERDTGRDQGQVCRNHFNSRAHVERDASYSLRIFFASSFQLTRSRGARHGGQDKETPHTKFQLTRSRGARPADSKSCCAYSIISTHALTWSATNSRQTLSNAAKHFNSRAHVERDKPPVDVRTFHGISTHALTWSATYTASDDNGDHKISTHALTWSATNVKIVLDFFIKYFNSRAHVERDIEPPTSSMRSKYFNSRAHVERDGVLAVFFVVFLYFNSRAHVERDCLSNILYCVT